MVKIDYLVKMVGEDKKATGDTTHAIFVKPELHFLAKSRTLKEDVISFESPEDQSFWQFLFPE